MKNEELRLELERERAVMKELLHSFERKEEGWKHILIFRILK
jgi:hypothetical protein